MNEKISISDFIPTQVLCGENQTPYSLQIKEGGKFLLLSYITNHYNNSKKEHFLSLPKFINKNNETFEVLGLLQAEMGKTNNGCVAFCNHEYQIIKKVMKWFEKELQLPPDGWRWYIKVNINEPEDENYKKELEDKVINYWLLKTKIKEDMKHPKTVSYIKNTINKKLGFYDYGTLIIEHKSNLFSQIIKNYVKLMSQDMVNLGEDYIKSFMKGIIAGEGSIAYHPKSGHYGVHISATQKEERELYKECLTKLKVNAKIYEDYKEMLISERHNLVQLLKQRLMCLSQEKYNKFLIMMQQYPNISEETGYFTGIKKTWNKLPEEKTNQILELYKSGIIKTIEIANKLGISQIKVCRVLKANNLGKRLIITCEDKRKEIAQFTQENLKLTQKQIAKHFNLHASVVSRACRMYGIKRGNESKYKIPEEKIQKIIEIYKQNPKVKISEIMKEVGVSSSVIKRVRKQNNLRHLGYMHLIGCNNKNYKNQSAKALKID